MICNSSLVVIPFVMLCSLTACSSGGGRNLTYPGESDTDTYSAPTKQAPGRASSCRSSDSNFICLALKYVVYRDSNEQSILSRAEVEQTVRGINDVWRQCSLGFQVEDYQAISPADYGLSYNPANDYELTGIRKSFFDQSTLLVVTTGSWNRTGSLGYTGANAWTSMPGEGVYGVVLERPVGTFSNIIAHELGHYLNLLHLNDASDLMNPIIYQSSASISSEQCSAARTAAQTYWQSMMR